MWDDEDRAKYDQTWQERSPEQRAKILAKQKEKNAANAIAAGREPGRVGRPAVLTPEEKEASRVAQNKKRSKRASARRTRMRAERAIAEGRVPGQVGQPRVLTDEQRVEHARARLMRHRVKNLEKIRANDNARRKAKTAERAVAEGRVPGVLGHLATFSAEDLGAYLEKWPREKTVYHARIKTQNSRAKKLGVEGTLTPVDVRDAYIEQMGCCAFCTRPFGDEIPEIDHWFPMALGGSNTKDNVKLLHKACNRTKGMKTPEELGLVTDPMANKGD